MALNSQKKRQGFNADDIKESDKIQYIEFPLAKVNFILMAISGLLIVVGFLLMLGSQNSGETFNYDIFSTRRIVVGPTMAFVGFVAMAIAIIYKKKKHDKE